MIKLLVLLVSFCAISLSQGQEFNSNLSCSTHGTKIVYVNDLPRFSRANNAKTRNILGTRYQNSKSIDRHAKVEIVTLNLPSFGASYDEFVLRFEDTY